MRKVEVATAPVNNNNIITDEIITDEIITDEIITVIIASVQTHTNNNVSHTKREWTLERIPELFSIAKFVMIP